MSLKKLQFEYDFHRHYHLKIKKETYVGNGLCGLVNIGNSCFMNSILQCLFNTLSLTDYFLSTDYKEDVSNENKRKKDNYLLMSYVTLVNNIWDTNQIIKPKSFVENLSIFHKKYFSLTQQDSHECLLYILEILHNSISYEIDVEIKGEPKSKADLLMKTSLESWQNFYQKSYSFIIETFNGSNINNVTCCSCKNVETIFEPFNTLSLDLPDEKNNIYECMNNYFKSNENIASYVCEKCESKGCNKEVKLWTAPNYLIIHLKRFKQTPNGIVKNSVHIDFPLKDLDITRFISNEKDDPNNYIYDLYAISQHSGTLDGGHYWASCKNLDGNWYNFNDANVSKYNNAESIVTSDSYILFYQRKKISKPIAI